MSLPHGTIKSGTYLPATFHKAIQDVAEERGMTFAAVLRDIVRQWVVRHGSAIQDV